MREHRFVGDGEISGRCTVASVSINEWLVRYGWARPLEEQDEVMAAALERRAMSAGANGAARGEV